MKKKGLIIATIVMVLVLAVSLTTATYAWFTVSAKTAIEGFSVSVTSNRLVEIGMKTSGVYNAEDKRNAAAYRYGTVDFTGKGEGILGGTWSGGTVGLGDAVDHQIEWGAQNSAVGFSTDEGVGADATKATYGNTGLIVAHNAAALPTTGAVIAANGQAYNGEDALKTQKLLDSKLAKANHSGKDGEGNYLAGDYAHLFLGVRSITALEINELVLFLDATNTEPNIGILAALHVAYRVDGGNWQDAQFYTQPWNTPIPDTFAFATEAQENAYKTAKAADGATEEQIAAVEVPTKGATIVIDLKAATAAAGLDIAQVEIIIYLAGADTDCNNAAAVNATGNIDIFFNTVAAENND